MAEEWFLQINADNQVESQVGTGKLLGRLCDKSLMLTGPSSLVTTGATKIFQCRPYWCWKVRGWGGNSSNDPTYCSRYSLDTNPAGSDSLLGDADQDYEGAIHCPGSTARGMSWVQGLSALLSDEVGDYSFAEWRGDGSGFGPFIIDVRVECGDGRGDPDRDDPVIDGVMLQFRIVNLAINDGMVGFRRHWTFPVALHEVLAPHCNREALDVQVDPTPDPDNPVEWVPWCRGNGTVFVDLW
jgi:hypothetical protein